MAPQILILKKKMGNLWSLEVEDTGKVITGPHRWGSETQAMNAAQIFASTWGLQVVMEKTDDEAGHQD